MERIPVHSIGYFTILLLLLASTSVHSQTSTVTTDDATAYLGPHSVDVTCQYTVAPGEPLNSVFVKRQRSTESLPEEIVQFQPQLNQSLYVDGTLQGRTVLLLQEDSVTVRFEDVQCGDEAKYICELRVVLNQVVTPVTDEMTLALEAFPGEPQPFSGIINPIVEHSELSFECRGLVGRPAGQFVWYGYLTGGQIENLSPHADPGTPYTQATCNFARVSTLRLNMTRAYSGITIRCVANQTSAGPPNPNEECGTYCRQTDAISVLYRVREEDHVISRLPVANEYIVGSDVTLSCSVGGNPPPTYTWTTDKDDNITQSGPTWRLTNLQLGDSALYTCTASNNVQRTEYNVTKGVNILVVATTTSTSTTTESPSSSTVGPGGGNTDAVLPPQPASATTTIIIVCVVVGVLIIVTIIIVVIFVMKRRNKKPHFEEPPSKPYNNSLNLYNKQPDLVADEKKHNSFYNQQKDDALTYADLKFDDKPRSRHPVMLKDPPFTTDYADINLAQV